MTEMLTTTTEDAYGQRFSEVTRCGLSVVVERYHQGAAVFARGGRILGGERVYEKLHTTQDEAEADYNARVADERAMSAAFIA